jgi:hypothetical protein
MRTPLLVVLAALLSQAQPGPYRTLNDRFPAPNPASRSEWEARAAYVREHVLASAGLLPLPDKTPLRPVVFGELTFTEYSISKVYFESLPGFFVTGNLYRPAGDGPFPAVLSPHGHASYGRLADNEIFSGPGRAITLARQGYVVFTYDMIGYNDSRQLTHAFGGPREKLWGLSLGGLQLWNSIRALDFMESLPYVRRDAIGVTGESGGGTQTFLLAAVDPRVGVAVPVNMISLHMQGGCLCENLPGLRLDINNVEIGAAFAPKPLLMISATGDWTNETLELEYPAVRRIYGLLGAEDRVKAVRFEAEHNYNKDSREAMYAWMAQWLKHAPPAPRLPERSFTAPALPDLLVFHMRPLPPGAASAPALTETWIESAKRQLEAAPLAVRAVALRHALGFGDARPEPAAARDSSLAARKVVLVAGDTADVERPLRAAGFDVRPIRFTAFDAAAAAKVQHFDTYNRTPANQRVADIVSALRQAPGSALVASGDEALAAALAVVVDLPRVAVLNVAQFDASSDQAFLDHLQIPGIRRAGDLRTASEIAGDRLVLHDTGGRLAGHARRLAPTEVVRIVREAARR